MKELLNCCHSNGRTLNFIIIVPIIITLIIITITIIIIIIPVIIMSSKNFF